MMLTALCLLASAPAAGMAPQPVAEIAQRLPAGTPVRLLTSVAVHSRQIVQGQRVPLQVAEDVAVDARVVIPRGTSAVGEIEAVTAKGMFGKAARFTLRPLFVELGGRRLNLSGAHEQRGSKAVAPAAVATVLTAGLGLVITGKSAELPQGSIMQAELRDDVVLPR